jgi:UDP-N-acetylmuramate dehydrogenase
MLKAIAAVEVCAHYSPMKSSPSMIQRDVDLAPMTTLKVGGAADYFADIYDEAALTSAIGWARQQDYPITLLGGGSNVLIADSGVRGLTIRLSLPGRRIRANSETVEVSLGAGEDWDQVVKFAVAQGWAGIECLVGIPGRVGAAPIQNIGAYGQEVCETVLKVRAYCMARHEFVDLSARDCGFGYRDSRFKRATSQVEIVTGLTLSLTPGGPAKVAYKELAKRLTEGRDLHTVMTAVQALRRQKSMLANTPDGNHRSAGSFFLNPILNQGESAELLERARVHGIPAADVPRWPAAEGRTKYAAAWLIEQSGLKKGAGDGPVGLSTHHTLALVNRGGAAAADIIDFARYVHDEVNHCFGVSLVPEPRMLGFDVPPL